MEAVTLPGTSQRWLTVPNALSLIRLCAVPIVIGLFAAGREGPAVVVYAAAASTDFFDGFIARRTGSVTELGKLLDPLADRVFIVALAVVLIAEGALDGRLAAIIIARDIVILGGMVALERTAAPRIAVRFVGKLATALLLFGLSALAYGETSFVAQEQADEVGTAFTAAGAIVYWIAGVVYAREGIALLRRGDSR